MPDVWTLSKSSGHAASSPDPRPQLSRNGRRCVGVGGELDTNRRRMRTVKPSSILRSILVSAVLVAEVGFSAGQEQGLSELSLPALLAKGNAGDPEAQCELGIRYERGVGAPQDNAESLRWFRKSANGGDAEAQLHLAQIYEEGRKVPPDSKEAMDWYTAAAQGGSRKAQVRLGDIFEWGINVPVNWAEAARWYRKAAEQGEAYAEEQLGLIYQSDGAGVKKDMQESAKWYLQAAGQGLPDAMLELAWMYNNGEGVPKDTAQGSLWEKKAIRAKNAALMEKALGGDPEAQCDLAYKYYSGDGMPKDYAESTAWYTRAAGQGYTRAQFILASEYSKGDAVPKDQALAYMWYNLAAANTGADLSDISKRSRDDLEGRMTPEQVAEGQRLTRAWLESHSNPVVKAPQVQ